MKVNEILVRKGTLVKIRLQLIKDMKTYLFANYYPIHQYNDGESEIIEKFIDSYHRTHEK